MVPQILASGATAITNNLISILGPDVRKACCIKGELQKLQELLSMIKDVVRDAEMQQVQKEAVKRWLRCLKEIAHDAEDVLDELAYEDLRYKMEIQNHVLEEVRNFFSCSNPIVFRFNMVWKLKAITEKLEGLQRVVSTFQLQIGQTTDSTINDQQRQTWDFVVDSSIIGRETDKSKIVDMLIDHGNQEILSVFAIVGLGGLGKTTLAQLVYKDESVTRFFDEKVWICVSNDFNVERLLAQMADLTYNHGWSMNQVVKKLHEKLKGKRFLLVLDDVWNENRSKWNKLATCLKVGEAGSKIIATTRNNEVAATMGAICPYHLKGLSEEESWSLFKRIAFSPGGAKETPTLELIGKEIVSKCKGVPLAVTAMGGLMHSKREECQWLDIKRSEIWNFPDESEILPALKLSYDQFPPAVKQCFSYCSIFPKDHEINKRTLIQLWMAQGYLGTSEGNRAMEDVGDEYFNYLQWNSFIQDVCIDEQEVWCKMHDLVHDLAQLISGSECSNDGEVFRTPDASKVLHYSSLKWKSELPKELYVAKGLRSLIQSYYDPHAISMLKFKLLRVLDLKYEGIKEIPSSIGNLKHLRYLNLSGNDMETLPDSITRLYNLQTLKLDGCSLLRKLPHEMRRLINLRYLSIDDMEGIKDIPSSIGNLKHLRYLELSGNDMKTLPDSITRLYNLQTLKLDRCLRLRKLPREMRRLINLRYLSMEDNDYIEFPTEIGQLSCLQTLSVFVVGKEKGRQIQELQHLRCLGGYLHIRHLENVTNGREEAMEAKLTEKTNLQVLKLSWAEESGQVNNGSEDDVLKGLQPHRELKRLHINYYHGVGFPGWMASMEHLVEVQLVGCNKCVDLPALGQLPSLEKLELRHLDAVKCLGKEFYGGDKVTASFPSLEVMELWSMEELEDWVEVINAFPCLKTLKIYLCHKLMNMPTRFPLLEHLAYTDSNGMVLNVLLGNNRSKGQCPEIGGSSNMEATIHTERIGGGGGAPFLTSLRILNIQSCANLTSWPSTQHLQSLQELSVWYCKELKSISLEGLQSLQKLSINGCKELKSTSLEGLRSRTTLRELRIGGMWIERESDVIVGVDDFKYLSSLESLVIECFSNLKSLPEQIQHLSTLKELKIRKLDNLEALPNWLAKLTSLERLVIYNCPRLTHLPTQEAMQSLVALRHLTIADCPILKERCDPEQGEEWHKIAHIPSRSMQYDRYCL